MGDLGGGNSRKESRKDREVSPSKGRRNALYKGLEEHFEIEKRKRGVKNGSERHQIVRGYRDYYHG
jgi:hypothetical protein